MSGHFRQEGYHFPDRPTPRPVEERPNPPRLEELKKQLDLLKAERKDQEEARKRMEREKRIREETRKGLSSSFEWRKCSRLRMRKQQPEKTARERLEEERKAEEQRREYAMVKAELEVRQRVEEAMEKKQRQGFRGLFTRSSKR